ncbi:uncharacterized, partial [Tachysurus ichikawai]
MQFGTAPELRTSRRNSALLAARGSFKTHGGESQCNKEKRKRLSCASPSISIRFVRLRTLGERHGDPVGCFLLLLLFLLIILRKAERIPTRCDHALLRTRGVEVAGCSGHAVSRIRCE